MTGRYQPIPRFKNSDPDIVPWAARLARALTMTSTTSAISTPSNNALKNKASDFWGYSMAKPAVARPLGQFATSAPSTKFRRRIPRKIFRECNPSDRSTLPRVCFSERAGGAYCRSPSCHILLRPRLIFMSDPEPSNRANVSAQFADVVERHDDSIVVPKSLMFLRFFCGPSPACVGRLRLAWPATERPLK